LTGNRLRVGGEAAERRRLFRTHIDVLLAKLRDTGDSYEWVMCVKERFYRASR
jgi:hypothetical protein